MPLKSHFPSLCSTHHEARKHDEEQETQIKLCSHSNVVVVVACLVVLFSLNHKLKNLMMVAQSRPPDQERMKKGVEPYFC